MLASAQSLADGSLCIAVPPIDSEEEAWCAANQVLSMSSCLSMHGFEFEAMEVEDRWILTTRDLNPTEGAGCRSTHLAVLKETGLVLALRRSGIPDIDFGDVLDVHSEKIEYEIVDGKLEVFGYELTPLEPLPDFESCEECDYAELVDLVPSPDQRYVLIVVDVRFTSFDAWLFDRQSGSAPTRIASGRRGRHLIRSEWHGDRRIEMTFAGMGYAASIFVDSESPGDAREVKDLLHYDADRDCFVGYRYDWDSSTHLIEVGTVFADHSVVETFPIALDNEYLSDSIRMFESVEIGGTDLIVTYQTTQSGLVRDVFQPALLRETN
ncbi:MAG: hypothetical protein QNI99_20205 [Woeseiaceae bacterium]|nr:hypothetical protein [Woeseiaceae bacterium]